MKKVLILFVTICLLGYVCDAFAKDNNPRGNSEGGKSRCHKSEITGHKKIDSFLDKNPSDMVKMISIKVLEFELCLPMDSLCNAPKPISDAKVAVWSSPFGISNGNYISGKTSVDGQFIAAVGPDQTYTVKIEKTCYETKSFDTDSDEVTIALKKTCDANDNEYIDNIAKSLNPSFLETYKHYDECAESMVGNPCIPYYGTQLICTPISRSPKVKEFRCLNVEESTALNNFLYGLIPNPETELDKIKSIPGITGAGCIIDADCMSNLKCTHVFGSGKPKICLSPTYDEWEFAYIMSRETQRLIADSVCEMLDTYSEEEPFGTSFTYEPQFSYFMDKVVEDNNVGEPVYEQTLMEEWDSWDKSFTFRCPRLLDPDYVSAKTCDFDMSDIFTGVPDCPLIPITALTIFPTFRFDIEKMELTYMSSYLAFNDCGVYPGFTGSGLWNDSIQAFLNGEEPFVTLPGQFIGNSQSVCENPTEYTDEKNSIDSKGSDTFPYWWYWGE